jgi:hypothetical protein
MPVLDTKQQQQRSTVPAASTQLLYSIAHHNRAAGGREHPTAPPITATNVRAQPPATSAQHHHHDPVRVERAPTDDLDRQGMCIKCGQRLFRTKTKGIFKQRQVKVPLSIPGQVDRGQCLQCGGDEVAPGASNVSPSSSINTEEEPLQGVPSSTSTGGTPSSSTSATYEGQFNVYRERDGKGVMRWQNGDEYVGDFFNGNRHGQGTLQFADGSEYVGEWECNLQHGIGTRRWNNGDCYTGQYKNGKRTGESRFYFANGDMYVGAWKEGVMEGFGRYYYASGQRFEGVFVQGKRKGRGKLQRTDGSLDIGVYSCDVRVGVGVRWSADRTQAWKMCDGLVKKKITIPEAVALDYDIEAAAVAVHSEEGHVV